MSTAGAGPVITGRVVLPVSNALGQSVRVAKEQWLRRGREYLLAEDELAETHAMEAETYANKVAAEGATAAGPAPLPVERTLSKAQLDAVGAYYSFSTTSSSVTPPAHVAIDLYGLDCPLAAALFATAAALPTASAASSSSQGRVGAETAAFASNWIVSAVVPDHCVVLEHAAIVAPNSTSSTTSTVATEGPSSFASSSNTFHATTAAAMASVGSAFVGALAAALSSSSSDASAAPLLPPLMAELMKTETRRVTNDGAVKPSAAAMALRAEGKRPVGSKVGLVYLVRSRKADAILRCLDKPNANPNTGTKGETDGTAENDDDDDGTAAHTAASGQIGAAAFTVLITTSTRPSLEHLLGTYVASGSAFLVGEVAMEAPVGVQPRRSTDGRAHPLRQPFAFPSLGALWLLSGVGMAVPPTMRVRETAEESLSRVVVPPTSTAAGNSADDDIIVTDMWDMCGSRPNRMLRIREFDAQKATSPFANPLVFSSSASSPSSSNSNATAVQHLTVALTWRLLVSGLAAQIPLTFACEGGEDAAAAREAIFGEGPLAAWARTAAVASVGNNNSGSSTDDALFANAASLHQHLSREALGQLSDVLSTHLATVAAITTSSKPVDAASNAALHELFLLSSDDEASLTTEGLSATSVFEEEAAARAAAEGGQSLLAAAARGLSAKELMLQVYESTTRSSGGVSIGLTAGAPPIAPSERVLFVAKLNPMTTAGGLATCFAQFGRVVSCEIPQDPKTGRSRCYAFVEFETEASVNAAYSKMGGVMIDNCAIHVDFCQSTRKEEMALLAKQREAARLQREQRRAAMRQQSHQKRPREEGGNGEGSSAVGSAAVTSIGASGGLLPLPPAYASPVPAQSHGYSLQPPQQQQHRGIDPSAFAASVFAAPIFGAPQPPAPQQ